jgi:hypothetical protein
VTEPHDPRVRDLVDKLIGATPAAPALPDPHAVRSVRRARRNAVAAVAFASAMVVVASIVWLADRGTHKSQIKIEGPTNSVPTPSTSGPSTTIAAPPRGALPVGTAFVGLDHNTGVVYALDANGHALRTLFTVAVEATHHWPTITQLQLGPNQTTLWYAANPTGVAPCSTITERNLVTGATHGRYQGSWIALSPDGTRLAYTGCILQDPTVYITDLRTGRAWTVRAPATALPVTSLGHLTWTPDSGHVLAEYLDGAQWKLANLTPSAQPGTISWGPTVLTLNNEDRLTTTPNALYVSAGTVTNTWSIDTYDWTYRRTSHTPTTLAPLEIIVYDRHIYFMGGLATGGSSIDTNLYRLETTGPPTQLRPGISDVVATNATTSPADTGAPCRSSDLRIQPGTSLPTASGRINVVITIANVGTRPCVIFGYPQLSLLNRSGRAVPFVYHQSGGMFVTHARPAPVHVSPGASAFAAFEKFRCDLGDKDVVDSMRIAPPDNTQPTTLRVTASLGYCGPNDPGDIVHLTPVEPTERALLGGP